MIENGNGRVEQEIHRVRPHLVRFQAHDVDWPILVEWVNIVNAAAQVFSLDLQEESVGCVNGRNVELGVVFVNARRANASKAIPGELANHKIRVEEVNVRMDEPSCRVRQYPVGHADDGVDGLCLVECYHHILDAVRVVKGEPRLKPSLAWELFLCRRKKLPRLLDALVDLWMFEQLGRRPRRHRRHGRCSELCLLLELLALLLLECVNLGLELLHRVHNRFKVLLLCTTWLELEACNLENLLERGAHELERCVPLFRLFGLGCCLLLVKSRSSSSRSSSSSIGSFHETFQ